MKKRISAFVAALMVFVLSFSFFAFAENEAAVEITSARQISRLNDEAGLLSKAERKAITASLDEKSEEMQFDFVIAFVNSTDGKDIVAFADDYFDYNGFGFGEDSSGVALVVCMGNRKYAVSACGEGIKYFTTERSDAIVSTFISDLKDGNYAAVCSTFLEEASSLLERGRDDFVIDTDGYEAPFNWTFYLPISVAAGLILAFITVAILKRGLKSVSKKQSAADYEVPGSMNVTRNEDIFLYRNVTSTPIPKSSDSGSDTHISSSGNTHSGTSGSF